MSESLVFPRKPFYRNHSKIFIRAIKSNDIKLANKIHKIEKYLVYDYDHVRS